MGGRECLAAAAVGCVTASREASALQSVESVDPVVACQQGASVEEYASNFTTGHALALASGRLPVILASEIDASPSSTDNPCGDDCPDQTNGDREPNLGCGTHSRRIVEGRPAGDQTHDPEIYASSPSAASHGPNLA